jgi:hypothetical protein
MRHCRTDYEAIQPWPTKRPHYLRQKGQNVLAPTGDSWSEADVHAQITTGSAGPIIPDDEPVFVLRSKDIIGPATVRDWCDNAESVGAEPALIERVRRFAEEMDAYAAEHYGGGKVADTPAHLLTA